MALMVLFLLVPGCNHDSSSTTTPEESTTKDELDGPSNVTTNETTVLGCTDPAAKNYNSSATNDDGTCIYPSQGCTDPSAKNYDDSAEEDDGSCVYPSRGCTDPDATNYDEAAEEDDGSCEYLDSDGDGTPDKDDACPDNPDGATEEECELDDQ